jgi:glyoxylase I family protein
MPARQALSPPCNNPARINYRVDDLDAMVEQLHAPGIVNKSITIEPDGEGKGKFTHLHDPEGNCIELWEHISARF